MRKLHLAIFAISLCFTTHLKSAAEGTTKRPKLAVVIVVDQMRADHLTRFEKEYKYGFARLRREGAVFTDAHQYHAFTVTAAGHASIGTGVFPAKHGVVGNSWFDIEENERVYCSDDSDHPLIGSTDGDTGRSPKRMRTKGLGDWLKEANKGSKVFGVSRKDRGAIMPAGMKPDGAFWYNAKKGQMVTSQYYYSKYPGWVDAFNGAKGLDKYFEEGWKRLKPEQLYLTLGRKDDFAAEADGKNNVFPHSFTATSSKPDAKYYSKIQGTPFIDDYILQFSRALIENEELGKDDAPDILFIGCSAADAIGHTFGPMSQESMDHFLRLDQYLGTFLDYLDERVGKENYVVALSSDHGVLPLPEHLQKNGSDAQRVSLKETKKLLHSALKKVVNKLGVAENLVKQNGYSLIVDYHLAARKGISRKDVNHAIVEELKHLPMLEDVIIAEELALRSDEMAVLYKNSYFPSRTGDLFLRYKKQYLLSDRSGGTSHGSPYRYDTHVPILFSGPGIESGIFPKKIRTVDIAPTLAQLLGIKFPDYVDGESLVGIISK